MIDHLPSPKIMPFLRRSSFSTATRFVNNWQANQKSMPKLGEVTDSPLLQDVQIQLLPGYLFRLIRMTSIVASGCLWQRAISCTCGKYTHHHYRQNDDQARCFPGWREENDQNFHETGFVSAVIFPVGIYGWAI
jgi:hypothetical protein